MASDFLTVGVCSTMRRSHPKSSLKEFNVYSMCQLKVKAKLRLVSFYGATRIVSFIVKPKKDRWPFLLSCYTHQAHAPRT